MSILNEILERYSDGEILLADGFDEAIIGIEPNSLRLIYSIPKSINILINDEELTEEEAYEHFYYNVSGSYVGEQSPIWVDDEF